MSSSSGGAAKSAEPEEGDNDFVISNAFSNVRLRNDPPKPIVRDRTNERKLRSR
jgi:hypothetical protein